MTFCITAIHPSHSANSISKVPFAIIPSSDVSLKPFVTNAIQNFAKVTLVPYISSVQSLSRV